MAAQLAVQFFFGEAVMAHNTAGTLEESKMKRIKAIDISKFGEKRGEADREARTGYRCTLSSMQLAILARTGDGCTLSSM